jgi:hypothetical protein
VRIGLAETKHFADGYEAIFGKRSSTPKGKPAKRAKAKKKRRAKSK